MQALQGMIALALGQVAVQRADRVAGFREFAGDFVRVALGGDEDERLADIRLRDEVGEQRLLVADIVRVIEGLGDIRRRLGGFDLHPDRVVQEAARQGFHATVEGRGEQHGAAIRRAGGGDRGDVLGEAHVEHAVGFVEDQGFELRQVEAVGPDVIEQAARGGDDDVDRAGHPAKLLAIRHAADDLDAVDVGELAEVAHRAGDLAREFAGRGEHQDGRLAGHPARGETGEVGKNGEEEGGGLASAGGGGGENVAAFESKRNRLFLDRGRLGQATSFNSLQDQRVKGEFIETHRVSFWPYQSAERDGQRRSA